MYRTQGNIHRTNRLTKTKRTSNGYSNHEWLPPSVEHIRIEEVKKISEGNRAFPEAKVRDDLGAAISITGNQRIRQSQKNKDRMKLSNDAKETAVEEETRTALQGKSEHKLKKDDASEEIIELRQEIKNWENRYNYVCNAVIIIHAELCKLHNEVSELQQNTENSLQSRVGGNHRRVMTSFVPRNPEDGSWCGELF